MLKGIDPILNAEVLGTLRAMGHGDDLILCDLNFPAQSVAQRTGLGRLLRIDAPMPRVARAVLSVYPIDSFVDDAAARMERSDAPDQIPDVQREVQAEIDAAEGRSWPMIAIERFAFYERAKQAYAVIQTGERRFWGCVALRKGVLPPEA
ncbi:MAG: RbsD/FucU family protein [Amaricoccus sp.]|uniref:RbsD/FucU family protein n=1 Tax=Amaricoccus sp. TaxID=1872485 RepID=UPI0039E5AE40